MSVGTPDRTARTAPGTARTRRAQFGGGALGLVVLAAAVLALPAVLPNDYFVWVATLICVYGTAALGWNILGGYANQVSLGHAVFFGIGAYAVAMGSRAGWSPWLSILVGVAASLVAAVLIGLPTLRLSGHYFALATLATLQIVLILATYFADVTGGPQGLFLPILEPGLANLQFDEQRSYLWIAAVMFLAALALSRTVARSRLGLQLFAIKQNPEAAALSGVNLFRTKMTALAISAVPVSVAGSIYLAMLQFVDPPSVFAFNLTVSFALFAIVGGVSVWWGPALGALLLVPLGDYSAAVLSGRLAPIGQVGYGLLLIVLILVQPRGLGGWLAGLAGRLRGTDHG